MRVLVPFDSTDPNTRLSPVLSLSERSEFAAAMCRDVCSAIDAAGHTPELLATAPVDCEVPVTVDQRSLSDAVNAALSERSLPVAVVMSDLPLVTAETVKRLLAPEAAIVLAPGLGGGTNALVSRSPSFSVDYHDGSYRKHRNIATAEGLSVTTLDSFRLALDIDAPEDLAEVLLHAQGRAATWLRDAGFTLEQRDGRAVAVRG